MNDPDFNGMLCNPHLGMSHLLGQRSTIEIIVSGRAADRMATVPPAPDYLTRI